MATNAYNMVPVEQEETKQLEENLNMLAINQPKSCKLNHGKVSG